MILNHGQRVIKREAGGQAIGLMVSYSQAYAPIQAHAAFAFDDFAVFQHSKKQVRRDAPFCGATKLFFVGVAFQPRFSRRSLLLRRSGFGYEG